MVVYGLWKCRSPGWYLRKQLSRAWRHATNMFKSMSKRVSKDWWGILIYGLDIVYLAKLGSRCYRSIQRRCVQRKLNLLLSANQDMRHNARCSSQCNMMRRLFPVDRPMCPMLTPSKNGVFALHSLQPLNNDLSLVAFHIICGSIAKIPLKIISVI